MARRVQVTSRVMSSADSEAEAAGLGGAIEIVRDVLSLMPEARDSLGAWLDMNPFGSPPPPHRPCSKRPSPDGVPVTPVRVGIPPRRI